MVVYEKDNFNKVSEVIPLKQNRRKLSLKEINEKTIQPELARERKRLKEVETVQIKLLY